MSHGKRRKETNCLNCGAELKGPYCHYCGQENLEPKETVWGLITHFVYDITHFDGKFFSSVKYLLLKPGFLAKEYMRGRRASYLNPVRMYVFTSAFFFILFFSISKPDALPSENEMAIELGKERQDLLEEIETVKDSATAARLRKKLATVDSTIVELENMGIILESPVLPDTTRERLQPAFEQTPGGFTRFVLPKSITAYDSAQAALPPGARDGWIKHAFKRKFIQLTHKYKEDPEEFKEKFGEKFLHSLPKLMFVSLPFVALFLMALYYRHKQFYYADHGIHVIDLYIALYLIILVGYFFSWVKNITGWSIFTLLGIVVSSYGFYYVYKSMRNFYGQSVSKTIIKYVLFLFLNIFLFSLLILVFVLNSLFTL